MTVLTIMQARTTSSRLPGKALLPIAGYPSAALAALRASYQGPRIIVATSNDQTDDTLANELRNCGIEVFRGPLQDVLGRFACVAADVADDAIIVRLTADNVLPDGPFVSELVEQFQLSGLEYMGGPSPINHLPYGLGGEVFRAALLREAENQATAAYDREHVTPWIRRHCRCGVFIPQELGKRDFGHLRSTIDDREDYERIVRLFSNEMEPVRAHWFDLMLRLAEQPGEPRFRIPYRFVGDQVLSTMTLGTAQLGMKYGIVNRTGKPSEEEARGIVRTAITHGVTSIDTARAYGDSEAVIGRSLTGAWGSRAQVITKLDPLSLLAPTSSEATVRQAVVASVHKSCHDLRVKTIPVLLLHRWSHHGDWGGAVWSQLLELHASGLIENLGASVYDPREASQALSDPGVLHLQIPFNILDHRWRNYGISQLITKRPEMVIHARSALLQGILGASAELWPRFERFDAAKAVLKLAHLAKSFGRDSVVDLCFAYVRSQEWITSVVVGCETIDQLHDNLRHFCRPPLTPEQCAELETTFADIPEQLLNPAKWEVISDGKFK